MALSLILIPIAFIIFFQSSFTASIKGEEELLSLLISLRRGIVTNDKIEMGTKKNFHPSSPIS